MTQQQDACCGNSRNNFEVRLVAGGSGDSVTWVFRQYPMLTDAWRQIPLVRRDAPYRLPYRS